MKYLIILLAFLGSASANEGIIFFEKKIRPALKTHCYRCHSDEENRIKGGLLVDTKNGLLLGGDSGPAIVPGDLDKSILWASINYHNDMEMPPKKPMSDAEIADFKKWILMGAPDPRTQKNILVKTEVTPEDIEKGKSFWSYKKPVYLPPETTSKSSISKIDDYIFSELTKKGISPVKDTSSSILLKRLYVDLVGLLPSVDQVKEFTYAYRKNPNIAVSQVVDRLLDSPQFGERWGRHWLDLARYAESTGNGVNSPFPYAWRYRDYVIKSFNDDKPYDQFVREQLAGDLIKVKSDAEWQQNLIATGFLAMGPKNLADQDRRQFEADLIDEQIDVVSRSILGISVACARCHDHKFEPIPQSDYYAVAGIFKSTNTFYGTLKSRQNRHGTSLIKLPASDAAGESISKIELESLKQDLAKAEEDHRSLRLSLLKDRNSGGLDQTSLRKMIVSEQKVTQLKAKVNSFTSDGKAISFCMGVQKSTPTDANILERGEVSKLGQSIPRGGIQVMGISKLSIPSNSTGRLELAHWLTSPDHPLTARVMANRVWEKLMGEGLVRSLDNFGSTGEAPTHPELLDYLAISFMNGNWSIKSLIKQIVLTKTYRRSSDMNKSNFLKDPENKLFWRISPQRLDAEVIRDSVLILSGQLNLRPKKTSQVYETSKTATRLRATGATSFGSHSNYRSVYLPVVRDLLPEMLKTFDFTQSMLSAGEREQNNTSSQALYMMNSKFILSQSDKWAKLIIQKNKTVDEQIKEAFAMSYGRYPSTNELTAARNLFSS
ncbi:MAG: PSD1 and planctomycete cytochrome C domain-containing protein, partial [Lentisphaeraceae bacterium]|nr:PSD1 and planctomycete cytochrome C domain-containing protein [Lentisphaeraceae bacterium]